MKCRSILLVLTSAAAVVACDNPVDTSENKLPYLSERETVEETEVVASGDCACLAPGLVFRFDKLEVTNINGDQNPVIETLNGLWKSDIEHRELNILVELTDVADDEVKAKVYNAARIDDTSDICMLADTTVDVTFPRAGCELQISSTASFNVYAGTETYPKNCSTTLPTKHVIPVSDARLQGVVANDCSAIMAGAVPSGALAQADVGKVCTCLLLSGGEAKDCGELDPQYTNNGKCVGCNASYQPLDGLLDAFQVDSAACRTADDRPAACLAAAWTAVAVPKPESCTP